MQDDLPKQATDADGDNCAATNHATDADGGNCATTNYPALTEYKEEGAWGVYETVSFLYGEEVHVVPHFGDLKHLPLRSCPCSPSLMREDEEEHGLPVLMHKVIYYS